MSWDQDYSAVGGSLGLSAFISALPILLLFGLLTKLKVLYSASCGLVLTFIVVTAAFGMPVVNAFGAMFSGALFGLFPIGWIVTGAIFLFDLTVATGKFDVVKESIVALTPDKRVQALLVAYVFSSIVEGAAGFSTPVALSVAMLIGVKFTPMQAILCALLSNGIAVPYGAVGTPIVVLSSVTGLDLDRLTFATGVVSAPFTMILPFWVIAALAGIRNMISVWPACLTVAVTTTAVRLLLTTYNGPYLVSLLGGAISLLVLILVLRVWQPKGDWTGTDEQEATKYNSLEGDNKSSSSTGTLNHPPKKEPSPEPPLPKLELDNIVVDAAGDVVLAGQANVKVTHARPHMRGQLRHRHLDSSSIVTALFPHTREYDVGRMETTRKRVPILVTDEQAAASALGPAAIELPVVATAQTMSGYRVADSESVATAMYPHTREYEGEESHSASIAALDLDTSSMRHATAALAVPAPVPTPKSEKSESSEHESAVEMTNTALHPAAAHRASEEPILRKKRSGKEVLMAWSPWLILTVVVVIWSVAPIQKKLDSVTLYWNIPGLHRQVNRSPPVADKPTPMDAIFKFNYISATGTAIMISALISTVVLKVPPKTVGKIFLKTVYRMRLSIITVMIVLAMGFLIRYGGLDGSLGLALASTGVLFPFFSPIIGYLGVALTGSSTSSNVLFGNLQRITAAKLGLSPYLTCAANASGGALGGSISIQSMVVAGVAAGANAPSLAEMLKKVGPHSLVLVTLFGIWMCMVAYAFPGIINGP